MLFVPKGADSLSAVFSHARPATAYGVAVTPGSGADGSWAQLFAALAKDAWGIFININTNFNTSTSRNTIIDIGVDVAGGTKYVELIPDIICGNAGSYVVGGGINYFFPIFIKAGSTVGVRGNSTSETAFYVNAKVLTQPMNPSMTRIGSFCEVVGTAGNAGTVVTSGSASEGTWTSLGTTAKKCWWWELGCQIVSSDISHNGVGYHLDLAYGDETNKVVLLENIIFYTTTTENAQMYLLDNGVEFDVPAGSTLYARAQCSGTADPLRIKAYGVGG